MVGLVALLAGYVVAVDRFKQNREADRPLPPANSPNVLLIVLDTVRADRLSLYGRERPTTPVLERLASRGIRFDEARATAPWTLPSHASMFTGRWPHEVGDRWRTPIRGNFPTLAEYLRDQGYSTAGFVANVAYCSQETGLARGFTYYEDYLLDNLAPLRAAALVDDAAGATSGILQALDIPWLRPMTRFVTHWLELRRKSAASIRRAFLSWLSEQAASRRPFFAFLNFFDSHQLYRLPPEARSRFVTYHVTPEQFRTVYELWQTLDRMTVDPSCLELARDAYDDCVNYLDEQLGLLFDTLQRHGVLDHTLVIVTSDHGEGLGDHDIFDHGESLYRTETRVPLVIRPPAGLDHPVAVGDMVSLRELPATVVDLVGLKAESPFSGKSLARFWRSSSSANRDSLGEADPVVSELHESKPARPERAPAAVPKPPMIALAEDHWVYIRYESDGTEQLFDEHADPQELRDRSRDETVRPILDKFRRQVERLREQTPR